MRVDECYITDQTYTHIEECEGNKIYHFNASAIMRWLIKCVKEDKKLPDSIIVGKLDINKQYAEFIRRARLEKPKYDRLTAKQLDVPILGVLMPNSGNTVIIDGNHRYVRRADRGDTWVAIYQIPFELAKPYLVIDVPKDIEDQVIAECPDAVKLRKELDMEDRTQAMMKYKDPERR